MKRGSARVTCILVALFASACAISEGATPFDSSLGAYRNGNPSDTLSEWARARQSLSDALDQRGIDYWGQTSKQVLLINGTADDTLSATLYPESGNSSADYNCTFRASNREVLDPSSDISMSLTETGAQVNITAALDFNRFPGKTTVTMECRRISDGSLYDSLSIDYLAAGLVVYLANSRTIVSGVARSFLIPTYEDLYSNRHRDFAVFVQYLNGSDSTQILDNTNSDPATLLQLSDIKVSFISYYGQILWDSIGCPIAGGEWDGTTLSLRPGCGMAFGIGRVNESFYDGFHFACDYELNRAGSLNVLFEWEQFTFGTDFEDELFTTFFLTEIAGQPPTVVRRVDPSNPFNKDGGDDLFVEMINSVDANITSFNVNGVKFLAQPGSHTIFAGPIDFFETIAFTTEPGTGKGLPWTISASRPSGNMSDLSSVEVAFIDESGFLFSYNDEVIVITSFTPNTVMEAGGEVVVIVGTFPSFDETLPNHNVLIGNIALARQYYQATSSGEIRFTVPPRFELGAAYEYNVVIQIGNSYSSPVKITYLRTSFEVPVEVFGASRDLDTGTYLVNFCDNTTFTTNVDIADETETYDWKLLNSSNSDILALENATSILTNASTLELPNHFIPLFDTDYKVVVTVRAGNMSTNAVYVVRKVQDLVLGVTIVQPENRTIAVPEVNMRIIAKVDLPECFTGSADLVYEWQYEDKLETILEAERMGLPNIGIHQPSIPPQFDTYVFSYQNASGTVNGITTPTRLGRELIVPRDQLAHGFHRIRLSVYSTSSTLRGSAESSVTIKESSLQAVIGTGQFSRKVADSHDLFVSGEGSFDPDVISGENPSEGLEYQWTCAFSLFANFSESTPCDAKLLPVRAANSSSFTVSSGSLMEKTAMAVEGIEGEVFVRYSLKVRKGEREGSSTQIIAAVESQESNLATYDWIEIVNSRGEPVDATAVNFWEDVILRPVAPVSTQWRFRLEAPLSEASRFLSSADKIISNPGYYTSSANGDPGFQRLPLGIRADSLQPHQTYRFSVAFQEVGKLPNEVVLVLNTVEVPGLICRPPSNLNGTTRTIFRASATTSFQTFAKYSYQFYVTEERESAREFCVDGCTGANQARFQIPKPGRYVLQCRLLAANGRTLLAVRNSPKVLTISASQSAEDLEAFNELIDRDYKLGDDGAVNQKGFFFSEAIHYNTEQVVALSDSSNNEACANFTRRWANVSRIIVGNEFPNTANARNYVSLASNYARLKCVEDVETLYRLLDMVDQSIARTPPEETLSATSYSASDEDVPNVELETELLRFYNFSMIRALSTVAAGSSRGRLSPSSGAVSNIVLDLSERWMSHITTTATNDRVCGWDATYKSTVGDGQESPQPLRNEGDLLGVNTIHVAVRCNPEQGTSLRTPHASFEWCDAVFQTAGSERKLITVAEQFDYPFLSGIQGLNRSDSRRIVSVDIQTLGESNQLVSAMSDNANITEPGVEGIDAAQCYRIGLAMEETIDVKSTKCFRNVPFVMYPRKEYGRQYEHAFEDNAYQRITDGIQATADTSNKSDTVVALSNRLGLYGADRSECLQGGHPFGLGGLGVGLSGLIVGILLLVLLITGLTYMLVSALVVGAVVAFDDEVAIQNWVDRDCFGRGDVRIDLSSNQGAASGGSSASTSVPPVGGGSTNAEGSNAGDELNLEFSDPQLPDHDTLLRATQEDLPARPPS